MSTVKLSWLLLFINKMFIIIYNFLKRAVVWMGDEVFSLYVLMKNFLLLRTLSYNCNLWSKCIIVKAFYTLFNLIKTSIGMIELHWKNSWLNLAFSATTKIFQETKLFNFTLFVPSTCISNIFGVCFVWLVVLSFCSGGYFSIFLKQLEKFNRKAPSTFQVMCFSPFIMG